MGEVLHRRLILLSDAIRLGFPARNLAERIERLSARCDSPLLLAIGAHASASATERRQRSKPPPRGSSRSASRSTRPRAKPRPHEPTAARAQS
jgi:hypothetical protein